METFSALLAICAENSPVPGEFPAQRPVMRSFDVLFDQRLNQLLSKQWSGWWFETLSCPLWRHRNDEVWIESSYVRENYTFVLYPAGDPIIQTLKSLRWRHNERDSVSNYQPHDFLLNRLFKRRSKRIIKAPRHWPLCGNSPGIGEFPAQMASNAENVSIWWRHHVLMD